MMKHTIIKEHRCICELLDQFELIISNCHTANFAWIKYIGHYIIDYVKIKINDQEIDCHTGEYLHFLHELAKKETKERGYNRLIGNIPELFEFNRKPKRGYQLKIPLKFWF